MKAELPLIADAESDVKTALAYREMARHLVSEAMAAHNESRTAASENRMDVARARLNQAVDIHQEAKRNLARLRRLAGLTNPQGHVIQ